MLRSSRRTCMGCGILLCFLLCTPQEDCAAKPSPSAFPPQASAQPTIPMLDEGKGLIHLDVSVTNGEGEPVSGLHREDFELLDEGHSQRVLSFHTLSGQFAQPSPPTQVILFVDTFKMSNVQASRVQLGIEQFLRQNGGRLSQPVSIFGLSEDVFGQWPTTI